MKAIDTLQLVAKVFVFLLWPAFAIAALMAFDAPNSHVKIWPWLFAIITLSMPFMAFLLPRYAFSAYQSGRKALAFVIVITPLAPYIAAFAAYIVMMALAPFGRS